MRSQLGAVAVTASVRSAAGSRTMVAALPSCRGRSSRQSGVFTRLVEAQVYSYSSDGEGSFGPAKLVVRYPQELRRERVRFTLNGLDLL